MNRTELAAAVAAKANLTKVDAKKAVDAALEAIEEALVANDTVLFLVLVIFLLLNVLNVKV